MPISNQSIGHFCGILRMTHLPILSALFMTTVLAGCANQASTNWEQSQFANKRALILEENVRLSCEGYSDKINVNVDSSNRFILKFRDGQNRQVYVGEAAACFVQSGFCQFAPTTIIIPENKSAMTWMGQVTGILRGSGILQKASCNGVILPDSVKRDSDGNLYKCDKISKSGDCYGRKGFLQMAHPKHRIEIVE